MVPCVRSLARLPSSRIVLRDRACPMFRPAPDFRGVTRAFAVTSANGYRRAVTSWRTRGGEIIYGPSEKVREAHFYLRLYTYILLALSTLAVIVTIPFMAEQFLGAKMDIVLLQMDS